MATKPVKLHELHYTMIQFLLILDIPQIDTAIRLSLGQSFLHVCSVLIISRLDSQSKFLMLTLFSGRHIGVPRMYTNVAFPYWAL